MRQTISITIEHIVVASNWSYDQVKESLEAQLSGALNIDELVQPLAAVKASWEQVTQAIEKRLGTSGFSLFSKVDHGVLLSLAGKLRRVSQYALGNPLLALQMVEHLPEVVLYAPLQLAVYEGLRVVMERKTTLRNRNREYAVTRCVRCCSSHSEGSPYYSGRNIR